MRLSAKVMLLLKYLTSPSREELVASTPMSTVGTKSVAALGHGSSNNTLVPGGTNMVLGPGRGLQDLVVVWHWNNTAKSCKTCFRFFKM